MINIYSGNELSFPEIIFRGNTIQYSKDPGVKLLLFNEEMSSYDLNLTEFINNIS